VLAWSGREGAQIVAVQQIADTTSYPVLARPEIKSWNDLRGKPLAVDAVDTAFALVLRRMLLDKGLDLAKGDYTFVPKCNPDLRLDSMIKGETFAGVMNSPTDIRALKAGMVLLGTSRESLPNYPHTVFAVSRTWAEKERAQLVGFIRAWRTAARWVKDNREEASKLIQTHLKVPPQVAGNWMDELSATGTMSPAALESVLELRSQFGLTPRMGPKIATYYDTSYFEAANPRK
jgi:ABC-type nitrate/sulfonate/bicarbonate transport system substrate-binding protein